jgi:hypothetical protein
MRYAKVDLRLWHDQRFRDFGPPPPSAQFLFLYLLTCPERTLIPGVIRARFSTVFAQFGWSERAGDCQVATLVEAGMVNAEDDLIWLPKALSHNRPANPNVVRAWRKCYDSDLPECELREHLGVGIVAFLREFPASFRQAFHAPRKAKAPARAAAPNGSGNGSANGSVNGSTLVPRTVRRITSTSTSSRSVQEPAAGAAGARAPFWRVLRLAQAHLPALRAEATEADRMDVLKGICAKHSIAYCGNLVGRVLNDARIAGQLGRA